MSVLVVSAEPVGPHIAGPSIRALELARSLAGAGIETTLAAPAPSEAPGAGVRVLEAGLADHDALLAAAREHDVIVAQQLPLGLVRRIAGLETRLVADLYNPTPVEVIEAAADEPEAAAGRSRAIVASQAVAMLAAADAVICASERQRDFWHGAMAAWGMAGAAPVEVVPFGLPDEPPAAGNGSPLRERFPEIGDGEPILLWGGGIWNWLDAGTPIRAVERLAAGGLRAHLVFLGVERPRSGALGAMSRTDAALAEAERRGLLGSLVHANHGWVPYAERGAHLLDADLGVSAHHAHLEARFAHRTRVLDYLWAGLPVVLSYGDPLADLAESEGLGRIVPQGDDAAFAEACGSLLGDEAALAACRERIAAVRPRLRWSEVTRPLRELCADPGSIPRRPHETRVLRAVAAWQYPLVARDVAVREGAGALAARLGRVLRRLRPGR